MRTRGQCAQAEARPCAQDASSSCMRSACRRARPAASSRARRKRPRQPCAAAPRAEAHGAASLLRRAAAVAHARRRGEVQSARARRYTFEHVSNVRWPLRCDLHVAWTCLCGACPMSIAPTPGLNACVCVLLKVFCADVSSVVKKCVYHHYNDHFQCKTTYIVTRSSRSKPQLRRVQRPSCAAAQDVAALAKDLDKKS